MHYNASILVSATDSLRIGIHRSMVDVKLYHKYLHSTGNSTTIVLSRNTDSLSSMFDRAPCDRFSKRGSFLDRQRSTKSTKRVPDNSQSNLSERDSKESFVLNLYSPLKDDTKSHETISSILYSH